MKNIYNSFCVKFVVLVVAIMSFSHQSVIAQGIIIYQKDGTSVRYSYNQLDRIETYLTEEDEPVVAYSVAVDLGLPSGTMWASYNVGATKPQEYGGFYAWGETIEKERYDWDNYDWKKLTSDITGMEHDVAAVKWGGKWHMPTYDQAHELLKYCTWGIATLEGVTCASLTGPNGKIIYFPLTGYKYTSWYDEEGFMGVYWTGTIMETGDSGVMAWDYGFSGDDSFGMPFFAAGNYGKPVRAVIDADAIK